MKTAQDQTTTSNMLLIVMFDPAICLTRRRPPPVWGFIKLLLLRLRCRSEKLTTETSTPWNLYGYRLEDWCSSPTRR